MRLLLINGNWKSDIRAAPPIGLCYVATRTQAAGHRVRVEDLCLRCNIQDGLKKVIGAFMRDVVGISN